MKQRFTLACIVMLAASLTGCDVFPVYTIVNRTGGRIQPVMALRHEQFLRDHPEFRSVVSDSDVLPIENGAFITFSSPPPPAMDYAQRGSIYRFPDTWFEVKKPYVRYEHKPLRQDFYILQIEPDGKVYILYADQTYPTDILPPQPEGFPLVPKISTHTR